MSVWNPSEREWNGGRKTLEPTVPDEGESPVVVEHVVSSNIESIGYNSDIRVLTVVFRDGGTYEYQQVPLWVFNHLRDATSKGQYFHRFIKGQYVCKKV